MLQKLKNWWDRREIREQQIREEVENARKELQAVNEQMAVYRAKEEADKAKRDSKEPWIEIKSADFSELKGFQIELDWNEAFIQHLKDNGITGMNEDIIVQKWLALLYQDLLQRLEQSSIDKSDKRINDFV